jgi:hypothetical protein
MVHCVTVNWRLSAAWQLVLTIPCAMMRLLLTTVVLYMIGEAIMSATTWTNGRTRAYDEVWYKTGCSLCATNRLFAQVIQPLLFRHIHLGNISQAKRLHTLT